MTFSLNPLTNASSHPQESELVSGDIWVIFLPLNVTPLIKLMDQGVLKFKIPLHKEVLTAYHERRRKKVTIKQV